MWIELSDGNHLDYEDPIIRPESLHSIATALGNICRFTGHCSKYYSVAEHSVHCARLAKGVGRMGLLMLVHDAHEAFVGDVNTPLKMLIPQYIDIERNVQKALFDALEIEWPTREEWELIKLADRTMLATEAKWLMPSGGEGWQLPSPAEVILECWSPKRATREWAREYASLCK